MDGHYVVTISLDAAVPFALIIILLDITLVYHASRTGRLQPWAFIILMIPVMGAIAYVVVELLPEMLSKAIHASAACHAGVQRVHIINGRTDEGLLAEVFSNEGIGTLIYANEYQQIRRALKKDVRQILQLTKSGVQSSELVKRTRAMIEKQINDYYIFEIDKNPVACVALHTYPEQNKGELASLFVRPSHENQGIGRKLIQFIEARATELGLADLITLSTQAFTYFQSKAGFTEGTPDDLPPFRREKYDASGRNSKVLVKKLAKKEVARS